MGRGGRKYSRNYKWIPCVTAYLNTIYPRWANYEQIIFNASLVSSSSRPNRLLETSTICPNRRAFTQQMRGLTRKFETKKGVGYRGGTTSEGLRPMWRIKR